MQRQGELHHAEVGAEVPASRRDCLDDEGSDLFGERREFVVGEWPQIGRSLNLWQ